MLFNQSKCKCLHIRRANGKGPYEMHNTVLLKTSKEKDLGVTISADVELQPLPTPAKQRGSTDLLVLGDYITKSLGKQGL